MLVIAVSSVPQDPIRDPDPIRIRWFGSNRIHDLWDPPDPEDPIRRSVWIRSRWLVVLCRLWLVTADLKISGTPEKFSCFWNLPVRLMNHLTFRNRIAIIGPKFRRLWHGFRRVRWFIRRNRRISKTRKFFKCPTNFQISCNINRNDKSYKFNMRTCYNNFNT